MIKLKQLLAEAATSGSLPGSVTLTATDRINLETQLKNAELITQALQSKIDADNADLEIQKAEKLAVNTERLIASFESKIKEQCLNLKRFKPSSQKDLCKQYYESLSSLNDQLLNLRAGIMPDSDDGTGDIETDGSEIRSRRGKKPKTTDTVNAWLIIAAGAVAVLESIRRIFPPKDKTETPGSGGTDGGLG
jgi:hypothetical protein